MTGSPTWYDLLDVSPDASEDEVRSAWKSQIADLEPGDRRFDALNRAAKVLLDPAARAEYDARLEAEQPESEDVEPDAGERPNRHVEAAPAVPPLTHVETERERKRLLRHRSKEQARDWRPREKQVLATRTRHPLEVPTWLLAGLAYVAVVLVAGTAWVWLSGATALTQLPGVPGDDEAAREAQTAAERAVVPVLSYDHRDLEGSAEAAQRHMTGAYRKKYDQLFAVIEDNAPQTEATVTAEVVASGIVRTTEDRVQVLVFVDRPTTNKTSTEPVVYKDQVTLSMQRVDDEWLVDDMITSPVSG